MFVAVETVAVDCPLSSPCLFASYSAARHSYMFHHQSLTDYQRSEMIRSPAAAATTQSSWWFVTSQCQVPVYNKTTLSWVCDDDAVSVCVCVCVCVCVRVGVAVVVCVGLFPKVVKDQNVPHRSIDCSITFLTLKSHISRLMMRKCRAEIVL